MYALCYRFKKYAVNVIRITLKTLPHVYLMKSYMLMRSDLMHVFEIFLQMIFISFFIGLYEILSVRGKPFAKSKYCDKLYFLCWLSVKFFIVCQSCIYLLLLYIKVCQSSVYLLHLYIISCQPCFSCY